MKSMLTFGGLIILFHIATAICWVVNLFQLFGCDFEPTYKEEIIHGVGVIIPWASLITVWL